MTIWPIPVQRYLVPPEPPELPADFVRVDERLLNGLPHLVSLGADATALLIGPTGLAVDWRDGDPAAVVSRSDDELVPAPEQPAPWAGEVGSLPARLLVRRPAGTLLGVVPLTTRRHTTLPSGDGFAGPRVELLLLGWEIRAGNLRGPGDFGGRISLAWRRADRAVAPFTPLPIPSALQRRLTGRRGKPALVTDNVLTLPRSQLIAVIAPGRAVSLRVDETTGRPTLPTIGTITRPWLARLRDDVDELAAQVRDAGSISPDVPTALGRLDGALLDVSAFLQTSQLPITSPIVQREIDRLLARHDVHRVLPQPDSLVSELGRLQLVRELRFVKGYAR